MLKGRGPRWPRRARIALWFVKRFYPYVFDDIWNDGFESGEEHALQCRGGPELFVVAEPQEGSQWGIGSAGNA